MRTTAVVLGRIKCDALAGCTWEHCVALAGTLNPAMEALHKGHDDVTHVSVYVWV